MERARSWAESRDKEKTDIASIAADAREKAKAETWAGKISNAARRVVAEAVAEIRCRAEAKRGKREGGG